MKRLFYFLGTGFICVCCQQGPDSSLAKGQQPQINSFTSYTSVGEEVSSEGVMSAAEMRNAFDGLSVGDTIAAKFTAKVVRVCKSKGCWMDLELPGGEEVSVKFRDYGFFVPKNIEKKQVVVNGKAFVTMVSVEEQQHFAEDAGRSVQEIAAIKKPRKTLSFLADGVLLEK